MLEILGALALTIAFAFSTTAPVDQPPTGSGGAVQTNSIDQPPGGSGGGVQTTFSDPTGSGSGTGGG